MTDTFREKLKKGYWDGESLEDLLEMAEFEKIKRDEAMEEIKKIHQENKEIRLSNARKSLKTANGILVTVVISIIVVLFFEELGFRYHMLVITFFSWLAFYRSYYVATKKIKEFD